MAVNPELAPFTLSRGIPSFDDQALSTIIQLQDCILQAIQQLNYSTAEFWPNCSMLNAPFSINQVFTGPMRYIYMHFRCF